MRLYEFTNQYVYHVTFTENVPKIKAKGLIPLQTSNWATGDGERYNKEGGVFAFAHPEDAYKWAFKTNWEFKKPVSILRFLKTNQWEKDPSADIMLQTGRGDALRSMSAIGPESFVDEFDFEQFGTPVSKDMDQQEWMQGIVQTLSEGGMQQLKDWFMRKLRMRWGKIGDKVRGEVVGDYLLNHTYFHGETIEELAEHTYMLKVIDPETARQYRNFSEKHATGQIYDEWKIEKARARNITLDSLIKHPPVVDADGYIWDGNHRVERAMELDLPQIPILMQVS